MKMELSWIQIRNFKGIKSFDSRLDGKNARITAENGQGKTSIYDAELWLFFGKDSKGRTDYGIVPWDRYNNPVKGVTTSVEFGVTIDGEPHVFKKIQTEKVTKGTGKITGYPSKYWIDEVPKLLKDYTSYLGDIITEKRFKLLTNLKEFNELHHTERRKILMEVAGDDMTEPEGFDEMIFEMGNVEELDEFKKVLKQRISNPQNSGYKDELEGINPRIDELLRGMEHPDFDVKEQEDARRTVKSDILKNTTRRDAVRGDERKRQDAIDEVNRLTMLRTKRESALACDTSAVQGLIDEKRTLLTAIGEAEALAGQAGQAYDTLSGVKRGAQDNQSVLLRCLSSVREEIKSYEKDDVIKTCSLCKQILPADKIKATKQARKAKIAELKKEAGVVMKQIETSELVISGIESKMQEAKRIFDDATNSALALVRPTEKRFEEITAAIEACPTPPPAKDESWLQICQDIKKAEKLVGDPVTKQLIDLDAEQTVLQIELNKINAGLAQADRMAKDKIRVQELKADEARLGQSIADTEKLLNDIELYKQQQSAMITKSVNGKFKHTKFKMFHEYLGSDGLKECCEAMYKGTLYGGLSTGEEILVGIDVINTLSEFYDCSVPLFIDRAESMTLPIEAKSQTIQLFAKVGVKELQVTIL